MKLPRDFFTQLSFTGGYIESYTIRPQGVAAQTDQRGHVLAQVVQSDDAPHARAPQIYFPNWDISRVIDKLASQLPNQGGKRVPLSVTGTSDLGQNLHTAGRKQDLWSN